MKKITKPGRVPPSRPMREMMFDFACRYCGCEFVASAGECYYIYIDACTNTRVGMSECPECGLETAGGQRERSGRL